MIIRASKSVKVVIIIIAKVINLLTMGVTKIQ